MLECKVMVLKQAIIILFMCSQFKVSVQLRGAKKFPALLVLLVTGVGPSLQGRRQRMNRENWFSEFMNSSDQWSCTL